MDPLVIAVGLVLGLARAVVLAALAGRAGARVTPGLVRVVDALAGTALLGLGALVLAGLVGG